MKQYFASNNISFSNEYTTSGGDFIVLSPATLTEDMNITTTGGTIDFSDPTATLDGASLSTDGALSGDSDLLVSTQKAVKTYIDNATEDFENAFTVDASDNVTTTADLNVGSDFDVSGDAVIDGGLTIGGDTAATEKKAKVYALIFGG